MSKGPEHPVEMRLKWLEGFGFEVLKLTTPGHIAVMDRMILSPKWSPSPPGFVECKAPGKEPRPAQYHTADDWHARGCKIYEHVSTEDDAIRLCDTLLCAAVDRFMTARSRSSASIKPLPQHVLAAYRLACQRLDQPYLAAW